MDENAKDKL